MRIEGYIKKSGRWWATEIPLLLVSTQGRTKSEALSMTKNAVEELIELEGFKVDVELIGKGIFSIGASDDSKLMAFALQQQRASRNLSIRDIAQRLGSKSPTSYSRYEYGAVKPSLDKFTELLRAIDENLEPILKIS